MCDYCGAYWHSTELVTDEAGLLSCPDDAPGMDRVATARDDADSVRGRRDRTGGYPPGNGRGTVDI